MTGDDGPVIVEDDDGSQPETAGSSPFGVKVICMIALVWAALSGYKGFRLIGGADNGGLVILGLATLALSLLFPVMIHALLSRSRLGWLYAMAVVTLSVLTDAVGVLLGDLVSILGVLVGVAILRYLAKQADVYGAAGFVPGGDETSGRGRAPE